MGEEKKQEIDNVFLASDPRLYHAYDLGGLALFACRKFGEVVVVPGLWVWRAGRDSNP
jgi:hypothetical protein